LTRVPQGATLHPLSDIRAQGVKLQPFESIQCPFCGQVFDVAFESQDGTQRLVIDCEICCRPLDVTVECEGGEVLSVDVRAN
jgi:hypothetical protein